VPGGEVGGRSRGARAALGVDPTGWGPSPGEACTRDTTADTKAAQMAPPLGSSVWGHDASKVVMAYSVCV
jgi:hypothetical protein